MTKFDSYLTSGVYCILNRVNMKSYIGSASNFISRWNGHLHDLRKNKHGNIHLQRAWNKYGEESFEFYMVDVCEKESLIKLEQNYINLFKCSDKNHGYNICKLAASSLGIKRREETKRRISEAKLKNPTRFWLGKNLTSDHKKKIGQKSVGRGLNSHCGSVETLKKVDGYNNRDCYRARLWHNKKRYNIGCYESYSVASQKLEEVCRFRDAMAESDFLKYLLDLSVKNRNKKIVRQD